MKPFSIVLFLLFSYNSFSQHNIDVQHYKFEIELNDHSDVIQGKATINVKFLEPSSQLVLNLASVDEDKGMQTFVVMENGRPVTFYHKENLLHINTTAQKDEVKTFEVQYMGNPKDGLIISKNKYGDRTFFSDNWPNRAHNWIPVNDHPSDKASTEFIVTAPAHYQVISNGVKVEEKQLPSNKRLTHWKEEKPLPTKIMVIGAATFAVKNYSESPGGIPVSAWVYPQDSAKGFYDYAVATDMLQFYSDYIAPFPYQKLANVQSKTIFGGMENASAIFYAEESVTGKRTNESTVAHEIVHQWFGNMATEKSFAHLWLSEGFATYLTHIYFEKKYGLKVMHDRLKKDRETIIAFAAKKNVPVVDSTSDLMSLLNANSYQKGGWVLHMLRTEVGDETFQKIIQEYYQQYKGSNADTRDFQAVAEKVSGKKLDTFFDQWLYKPGVPRLSWKWKPDGDKVKLEIKQTKDQLFKFPLEIEIMTTDGKKSLQKIQVTGRETEVKIDLPAKPMKVVIDPNVLLLFEEVK